MANAIVTHAKSIRILQAVYSPEVTVSWRGTTDREAFRTALLQP